MARKRFAFQGERGAFSEVAGRELVGTRAVPVPCKSFDDVFHQVQRGKCDVGVIPIENSLIGSIHINYDLLLHHKLHVIAESQLRIVHCLIARPGATLRKVKQVLSHPAALDQCRGFFGKHRRLVPEPFYDTAGAVRMLSETDDDSLAAIASPYAAKLYGMRVLKTSIEDDKQNFTRFLLLSKTPVRPRENAKTSIAFSLKSKPGALFKALSVFALRDINLSKIESRPLRGSVWRYHFYVDFEGVVGQTNVDHALRNLEEITDFIRVFGSYPRMKH